jgi:type IV fimbrial biogenesis protein FimT
MSEVCNTLTMDKEPGFTLVELLITIVVLSILLAAGAPAFKDFIKNNRVTGQINNLVSVIQLARSEALKRGTNMVVCASDNQTTCTGKDTWADGWILFSDLDRDSLPDVGTGKCLETEDCIMATRTSLPEGTTLTTDSGNDNVCFLPTGLSGTHTPSACNNDGNIVEVEFTLQAKNCEKTQARQVKVTKQGHTLVSTVACS